MIKPNFEIMASYNALMNKKICDSISITSDNILWENKKAFFGSILGTLNHLMVGDLIWLNRFDQHPSYPSGFNSLKPLKHFPLPTKLTQILYDDKQGFSRNRYALDQIIIRFIEESDESDYSKNLSYRNTNNDNLHKSFSMLLQHLFNHQTHHRGQVTTLLSQMNIDIGETDLLMLIPNIDDNKF
ncbi:DinB family protein [Psychrobacter sp. FBL11]|uniref:DinB family protein n=1 Tax=Psychrobacter saeujeotis TaxID=3143436 RepID=A0ABU9X980_9GAMM|nr:DinB family protein [uncultured Psychrobacter sp.]